MNHLGETAPARPTHFSNRQIFSSRFRTLQKGILEPDEGRCVPSLLCSVWVLLLAKELVGLPACLDQVWGLQCLPAQAQAQCQLISWLAAVSLLNKLLLLAARLPL